MWQKQPEAKDMERTNQEPKKHQNGIDFNNKIKFLHE